MRCLIIDDNIDFANALATKLGDSSEVLSGVLLRDATLKLAQSVLERKLANNTGVTLVLVNRELKLDGVWRQNNAGETIVAAQSWKHDPHFLLYSFRQLEGDLPERVVRLPFVTQDLVLPNDTEIASVKIEECLSFIDKSFKKIQHGFKQISPTAVDLMRLISGAVKAGWIRSEVQFKKLEALLFSFSHSATPNTETMWDRALDFDEAIRLLVGLYFRQGNKGANTLTPNPNNSIQRVVVVDDEVINEEGPYKGQSPWASLLDVVFENTGRLFSTTLPSKIEANISELAGSDLILLDMDFELDVSFKGDKGYGGLELLKRIRHEFPRIPVVVMSRFDEIGLYNECMALGAFDYLTKSWTGYRKFRTQESERDWFLIWQSRIEVPLQCRPFFDDVELIRRSELVSRKEAQHFLTTLRDIESPSLETLRALVAFFEQFVIGYLYYRGQTPDDTLDACLKNSVFASTSARDLPISQVLRIIRNNVTHHSGYTSEKPDAWLALMLLRSFYLALLSPNRLFKSPLMNYLNDKLAGELSEAAEADDRFFANTTGVISDSNRDLIRRRNQLLSTCLRSTEIELDEFKELADAFVKSVAVLLPRNQLHSKGFQLPSLASYKGTDIVRDLIKPYNDGTRFKRGYELFSAVWWLFKLYGDLVEPWRSVNELEKSLLRAMMVRCWIWYFEELLKGANEILFASALDEIGLDRNTALASVNRRLVQHFQKRKMQDFIPAYCLLVGLTQVNSALEKKRIELETESSQLEGLLVVLTKDQKEIEDSMAQVSTELLRLTDEISQMEERLVAMGPSTNKREVMEVFSRLSERLECAKREASDRQAAKALLEERAGEIEFALEEISERREWIGEGFAALSDSAGGRMSVIDKPEVLARRLRRQARFVERSAKSRFSIGEWIRGVMVAANFDAAELRISELRNAIDEDALKIQG